MVDRAAVRLVVLGDLHGAFDDADVERLDALGVDAILVVGDLGHLRWRSALPVAEVLARLKTPTWMIVGNHDGASFPQVAAEALGPAVVAEQLFVGMADRLAALDEALGPVRRVGFSRVELPGGVHLIGGRPHSMGGPGLSFRRAIETGYGIRSMEEATERLIGLVDEVDDGAPIVFLAHNGPTGFGDRREDLFGRDFHPDQGDWGDPDLAAALDHAEHGGRVVAVAAGHMHHRLRGGGQRQTWARRGRTLVVNAARVPRIERSGDRHHVELLVSAAEVRGWEVRVSPDGGEMRVELV
jgi:uncharacterized protein (TIGR04168 family)